MVYYYPKYFQNNLNIFKIFQSIKHEWINSFRIVKEISIVSKKTDLVFPQPTGEIILVKYTPYMHLTLEKKRESLNAFQRPRGYSFSYQ